MLSSPLSIISKQQSASRICPLTGWVPPFAACGAVVLHCCCSISSPSPAPPVLLSSCVVELIPLPSDAPRASGGTRHVTVTSLWCDTNEMEGEKRSFSNRESSRWLIVFLGRERGLPEDSCGLQEIQHCFNVAVWLQFPRQAFQLHFLANRTFLGLSLQSSFSSGFALPDVRAGCFKEPETSSSS